MSPDIIKHEDNAGKYNNSFDGTPQYQSEGFRFPELKIHLPKKKADHNDKQTGSSSGIPCYKSNGKEIKQFERNIRTGEV